MAYRKRAVTHPTKKGMGGHHRPMDWNYNRNDHPKVRTPEAVKAKADAHREDLRNNAFDEIERKKASGWVPLGQTDSLKARNSKPKKKRRQNTNVSTGSSSLKINRSNSNWGIPLNL